MGALEDAIREHLDLKRRHGASDEELTQQEAEALGPARRDLPDDEAEPADAAPERAEAESDQPAPEEASEAGLAAATADEPPERAAQDTVIQASDDEPARAEEDVDPDFGGQRAEQERPGSEKQPPHPDFE